MTSANRQKLAALPLQTTIYLDCNATTHTHPLALQAAREAMELCYGNPSSTHITGLHAKSFLESARDAAALAVGASNADEIIFNSGATEGIQSSVFSVLIELMSEFRETGRLKRWKILYGATEHKAVPAALEHWSNVLRVPVTLEAIPVDTTGLPDLDFVSERLPQTALICTMAVNNETGVIQPLQKISELLASPAGRGCLWFVDGVQALGKIPFHLSSLGAHYACFSGHKLNAPKGIGFLWVRSDAPYTPMIVGGGQERGKRSGTENLPGAAAFGRILRALNEKNNSIFLSHTQLEQCRQKLIAALTHCFPTLVWNADLNHCVPTTLNFSVDGISGRELMNALDAAGVRVSGGSACSSGKANGSHVLTAMNLPKWRTQNAIRLSFGPANSELEIEAACEAIRNAGEALRASCMIPQRPARADQVTEMLKHSGQGISELRSSDGTRAWLIVADEGKSFLVADCESALQELKTKLSCRGLPSTQILRLDAPMPENGLPEGWAQLKSTSGISLLFTLPTSMHSNAQTQISVLFSPLKECFSELAQSKFAEKIDNHILLACCACEPTALTAYEFSSSGLKNLDTLHNQMHSNIECNKEELAERLRHQHFTVLDVREPFESATSHLDDILNHILQAGSQSLKTQTTAFSFGVVPLSRLPQFMIDRLASPRQEKILCVCRSGQRSLQAAELLRRIQGCDAYSLKGGVADLLAPTVSLPPRSAVFAGHDQ